MNTQLFGTVLPEANRHELVSPCETINHKPYNLPSPLPEIAPMSGFVTNYINTFPQWRKREPTYDEYKIIMECFTPQDMPVISALAHNYALCDHYHASVPSQTFCNRSFVHSATSNGFVVNEPYVNGLFTHAPMIYNRIEDAHRPDVTSFTRLLTTPQLSRQCAIAGICPISPNATKPRRI